MTTQGKEFIILFNWVCVILIAIHQHPNTSISTICHKIFLLANAAWLIPMTKCDSLHRNTSIHKYISYFDFLCVYFFVYLCISQVGSWIINTKCAVQGVYAANCPLFHEMLIQLRTIVGETAPRHHIDQCHVSSASIHVNWHGRGQVA